MTYYLWVAALTLLGFPVVAVVLWCKYHTLQYRFDDGISMSWGILFRRETHLTYRRMQDIHVTRNLFHRWLGLAAIGIQTASGSAGAEMTIEGVTEAEKLRDYLYSRMRGVRQNENHPHAEAPSIHGDEALSLLKDIRDELRRLREARTTRS